MTTAKQLFDNFIDTKVQPFVHVLNPADKKMFEIGFYGGLEELIRFNKGKLHDLPEEEQMIQLLTFDEEVREFFNEQSDIAF